MRTCHLPTPLGGVGLWPARPRVDFGEIGTDPAWECGLGVKIGCAWSFVENGQTVDGDMRLEVRVPWQFTREEPSSNQCDLRSLVSHEIGHLLGLGHVDPMDEDAAQVMSEGLPPGFRGPRRLGRSDIRGVRLLYPLQ